MEKKITKSRIHPSALSASGIVVEKAKPYIHPSTLALSKSKAENIMAMALQNDANKNKPLPLPPVAPEYKEGNALSLSFLAQSISNMEKSLDNFPDKADNKYKALLETKNSLAQYLSSELNK